MLPIFFFGDEFWYYANIAGGVISTVASIWLICLVQKSPTKTVSLSIIRQTAFWYALSSSSIWLFYVLLFFFLQSVGIFFMTLILIQISALMTIYWTLIISIFSFRVMTKIQSLDKKAFYKNAKIWGFAILIIHSCISSLFDYFVEDLYYKFIITTAFDIAVVALGITIPVILYIKQTKYVTRYFDKNLLHEFNIYRKRLILIPLVQALFNLPLIILDVQNLNGDYGQDGGYQGFFCLIFILSGLVNSIILSRMRRVAANDNVILKEERIISPSVQQDLTCDQLLKQALDDEPQQA